MDGFGRLLLTVLLISASSCIVQAEITRYSIEFTETLTVGNVLITQPLSNSSNPIPNKGRGWVKHNNAVHTTDGTVLGSVSGLFFYHSQSEIEDVVTITFSSNLTGIWNGSSLNLRGLWKQNAEGTAGLEEQELSIVGGQGGLRGATGSVYYKRIQLTPSNKFLVTCDIFVDESKYKTPKTYVDLNTQFKFLP